MFFEDAVNEKLERFLFVTGLRLSLFELHVLECIYFLMCECVEHFSESLIIWSNTDDFFYVDELYRFYMEVMFSTYNFNVMKKNKVHIDMDMFKNTLQYLLNLCVEADIDNLNRIRFRRIKYGDLVLTAED